MGNKSSKSKDKAKTLDIKVMLIGATKTGKSRFVSEFLGLPYVSDDTVLEISIASFFTPGYSVSLSIWELGGTSEVELGCLSFPGTDIMILFNRKDVDSTDDPYTHKFNEFQEEGCYKVIMKTKNSNTKSNANKKCRDYGKADYRIICNLDGQNEYSVEKCSAAIISKYLTTIGANRGLDASVSLHSNFSALEYLALNYYQPCFHYRVKDAFAFLENSQVNPETFDVTQLSTVDIPIGLKNFIAFTIQNEGQISNTRDGKGSEETDNEDLLPILKDLAPILLALKNPTNITRKTCPLPSKTSSII